MLFIDRQENKLVQYDCCFTDREKIISYTLNLLANYDRKKYEIDAEKKYKNSFINSSILRYEEAENKNNLKVTEIWTETPYTIGFLGFYMQNNWLKKIYQCYRENSIITDYFSEKIAQMGTTISLTSITPQPYMMKCDNMKLYDRIDRIFEHMKSDKEVFELFLKEYYKDLDAFLKIVPYFELIALKEWDLESKNIDQIMLNAGEYNNRLFEQTDLKQKIKK